MYLEHFGLHSRPFRVAPSPSMLYPSETHDEGRARILYGVRENRGFVVVTGAIGLGKTTVLMSVLDELEADLEAALIFNPVEQFNALLQLICMEFGVPTNAVDEVGLLVAFHHWLIERHAEGKHCVLLIDEAQNLPRELLEKLRLLSNLQTEDSSLLQIVLVGQPELFDKLRDPRLAQLRQRIGVWHEIVPLSGEETREYVHHRLATVGAANPRAIVGDEVCALLHSITGGVPRMINQLCDTALVIAYGANVRELRSEFLRDAAVELRLADPPLVAKETSLTKAPEPEPAPAKKVEPAKTVAGNRPARAAAPSAPSAAPRGRRRSAVVAWVAVCLVLLAVYATRSEISQRLRPLWSAFVEETQAAESIQPEAADSVASEAVVEAVAEAPEEPTVQSPQAPMLPEAYSRKLDHAQSLIANTPRLYLLHLASFEAEPAAQRFGREFLDRNASWSEPVLITAPTASDSWYRVMTGPFPSVGDARTWASNALRSGAVEYAQVATLPTSARFLFLGSSEAQTLESK